jgi:hypothetical protein
MNDLYIPQDFATPERKRWVDSVSPLHRHESFMPYLTAWIQALIFNTPMPHERRRAKQ